MNKLISIIILVQFFYVSCNAQTINKSNNQDFNLETDIFAFSSKINENDTLEILANLSACTSWWHEKNVLIKHGNRMSIKTFAEGEFIASSENELQSKEYAYNGKDSLNFENLFKYMDKKSTKDRKTNSKVFSIIYNQDTISYFSDGLSDHLRNIDYYVSIKRRIYPDVEIYQPIEIPKLPNE